MPAGSHSYYGYWLNGPSADSEIYPKDGYTSEIDIAEGCEWEDGSHHEMKSTFHNFMQGGNEISLPADATHGLGTSYENGWHTYKIIWNPYEVIFYIDNVEKWRRSRFYSGNQDLTQNDVGSNNIQINTTYHERSWFPNDYMATVLQMHIQKNYPIQNLPDTMQVEYVKVGQFFLAPEITVPSLICTSGTSVLDVDPAALNFTWSLTPTNLFSGNKTGEGKTATITAATGASGQGKITYSFQMPSGEPFTAEKTFWVGKPGTPVTSPSGYPTLQLVLGAYQPISLSQTPGFTGGTINWWSTGSITPVGSTSGTTCTFNAVSLGTGNFYVTVQNTCGTSPIGGGTVNVVSGGGGQLTLVLSPNPASSETSLSIESTSPETTIDESVEWDLEIYDQVQTLKREKDKTQRQRT